MAPPIVVEGASVGPYDIVRKLATGGMADVFLARQFGEAGFVRDLVLKRLFAHLADRQDVLRMFQHEAQLMALFRHPNIPQVYDLGVWDGSWQMAMEFVEGPSVADLALVGGQASAEMPLPAVVSLAKQLADALHHVHGCCDRSGGWLAAVHRDVTPDNVLVTRDGIAKLIDFGVAQSSAHSDDDRLAGARGTLSYMAPEQIRGELIDGRADVFAVGVILYELSTGTRLFRGPEVEVMTAVVERDPAPPTDAVANYPVDLAALVMQALARDPDMRFSSARALAEALDTYALRHGFTTGPEQLGAYVRRMFPGGSVPAVGGMTEPGTVPDPQARALRDPGAAGVRPVVLPPVATSLPAGVAAAGPWGAFGAADAPVSNEPSHPVDVAPEGSAEEKALPGDLGEPYLRALERRFRGEHGGSR